MYFFSAVCGVRFSWTMPQSTLTILVGFWCWKTFLPAATPAPPALIEPYTISQNSSSFSDLGPPAMTMGTGQPLTTSLKVSGFPV